jgi:Domain of unknown function (DUF4258)
MSTLQSIRQKVLRGEYFFSIHALEELENDNFTTDDAVCALLNGEITEKLTYDTRGTRYVVCGNALDKRVLEVVCRFHQTSNLLIITCYEIFE